MKCARWWPWAALALVVIVTVVALIVRSRPSTSAAARADRLEQQLACPVCEGQSVADSNSFEARSIRTEIPQFIAQGQTDAQIRAYYVARYGDRILLSPSNTGLGVIAWGLPALVLVLGGAGIVIALRRWSRTPRLTATADDEAIVASAREASHED